MKEVQPLLTQIQDLSGNVQTLQTQVNGLVTAQQQYATQLTGGSAPNISGATESDADSSDDDSS
jgi:chaperonin cofactor prefoldin